MNADYPFISVVMAAHHVDEYLRDAILSIANQTYHNIEFIICANGAEHIRVKKYIADLATELNIYNVRILSTPIAQLGNALNQCIAASTGSLIARMDSDDVAYPGRIEEQFHFLINNNLDMVGSQLRLIDGRGVAIGFKYYPLKGCAINRLLPFINCFAHNTVLIKRELLLKARGYCGGFNAEDYDLWLRLRRLKVKWENMNVVHLDYRIHDAASRRRRQSYAEACGHVMREFCYSLNPIFLLAFLSHFLRMIFRARA